MLLIQEFFCITCKDFIFINKISTMNIYINQTSQNKQIRAREGTSFSRPIWQLILIRQSVNNCSIQVPRIHWTASRKQATDGQDQDLGINPFLAAYQYLSFVIKIVTSGASRIRRSEVIRSAPTLNDC